jgi:HPt (histidine-containing phosphotransfer) domain-containing protein
MDTATRMAHDLKSMTAALGVYAAHREAAALEEACLHGSKDIGALEQNVTRVLGPVIEGLRALGPAP